MKKYYLGLVALVLAIGFTAFTAKRTGEKYFSYNGPDFSSSEVVKISNWVYSASAPSCSPADDKPCSISVDQAYHHPVGSDFALNTTASGPELVLSIQAVLGDEQGNYIVDNTTGITTFVNKD